MSVPQTQIVMLDFRPTDLTRFMRALMTAIPESAWFSEVFHNAGCPLEGDGAAGHSCTCDVARVVIIKRLPPVVRSSGNGGRGRPIT